MTDATYSPSLEQPDSYAKAKTGDHGDLLMLYPDGRQPKVHFNVPQPPQAHPNCPSILGSAASRISHLGALQQREAPLLASHERDGALGVGDGVAGVVPDQGLDHGSLAHAWGALHQHDHGRRLLGLQVDLGHCTVTSALRVC